MEMKDQNTLLKVAIPLILLMCCLIFLSYKDYLRQQTRLHLIEEVLRNTELLLEQQQHQLDKLKSWEK